MKSFLRLSAAATALCVASPAAWALTAEEAWEAWVDIAATYGENVTAANTSQSGGVLTASGVAVAMEVEEMSLNGSIGDVTFTENGDGTVAIAMPSAFDMMMTVAPEYGEKVELTINFQLDGLDMSAADADGGVAFTYSAPSMVFAMADMMVDGETIPFSFTGTVSGSAGTYTKAGEALSSQFTAEGLQIDFDGRDPEGTGQGKGSVTMADLVTTSTGQGQMMFMDPEKLPEMLKAGASMQGSTSVGATTFAMEGTEDGESFAISGDMDGGTGTVTLNAEQVLYAVNYTGFDMTMSGSEIPLPEVTLGMGETSFNVIMPLAQSDAPKPYMLAVGLKDITIADGIWNMFDPGTVLPRDPATLTFNLAGTGKWLIDILDAEAMANPQGMPGEVHSLNISDVLLKAGGAELTANGTFTFDNTDLMTFGGMPAPDGSLTAKLSGANGLLDNLVKMGFVPADQANGVKMMSGMFFRPGDGPDVLTTEIGVSPDGTVSANGIPIPLQ
ncbi:DUF2125 domain-containing protein [Oceanicola sp. 502str15]|uniref:DUF2125 domain-containing protein n=1 Tax=Oceanicola sp. 502str15 TaxID=2696061 RepID=UPI00209509EF|nr:DUF2125 domain-containing protein [Oceanicola sp. 502str15]MCO6384434.1 DUF2125 domain-containing protein [Oceanicola sp. 502str15]